MFNAVNVADRYFMGILRITFVSIYIILLGLGVEANSGACGGVLNQSQGFIQTPNFPGKFKVPIKCKWVIDASAHLPNATLTVHLTQLYVTTGLKFTGLPYYDPENTFALGEKFGESPVHNVSENNVLTINWLKTDSQYLAVYFELNQLEGNHIRALDNLLDVYGFNITYQVRNGLGNADSSCSVVRCSYNGHCFANHNFSEYRCVCFHGFSGKDCGEGPLCRPDRNPCMNNGTCRHVGSSSVICNCPASYTGSKCEIAIQPPSPDCPENEGKEADCVNYCAVRQHEAPCSCKLRPTKQVSERSRYQIAIQVATQSLENSNPSDHFKTISSRTSSHQFEKSVSGVPSMSFQFHFAPGFGSMLFNGFDIKRWNANVTLRL
ncbi:hypothetical protein LSTR_LSTR012859 [Laodelphax striatellus]|uniref:EGF-like domain-containing protein n=1 Tax=Laodelphax striatellus TaxID=195883 RepID=A0A482WHZ3_LAOST|nr:hypothetical protein LSTR_LSTR012859 [Laodelphax striatellus]